MQVQFHEAKDKIKRDGSWTRVYFVTHNNELDELFSYHPIPNHASHPIHPIHPSISQHGFIAFSLVLSGAPK